MTSFEISTLDVLRISFSAHACLLLRALLGKLVDCLLPLLSNCSLKIRTLHRLHERAPDLVPRMLSEQVSLMVVAIVALVALSHTSVSLIPFGHQSQPRPDFLIRVVLCANAARYMVMTSWLFLGREITLTRTGTKSKAISSSAAGESGSHVWDFLYFVVCGGTTLLSLGYRQNFLLAMTLPFLELSSIFSGYCKLSEVAASLKANGRRVCGVNIKTESRAPRGLILISCIICFICRAVLPTLFLALGLQTESPLVMDGLPLAWFLLSCAFMSMFHFVLIYIEILNVKGRGDYDRLVKCNTNANWGSTLIENLGSFCRDETGRMVIGEGIEALMAQHGRGYSLPIHNHPDSLTNDIYQDIALEKRDATKCHVGRLRDLNYGLLRPCDNRNISCYTNNSKNRETSKEDGTRESSHANSLIAADKINVVRKKDMSKTWLLYRLLANSFTSSPPLSTTSLSSSVPSDTLVSGEGIHDTADLQPWMFPVLFDASSNTKLPCKTHVVRTEHDTPEDLDHVDGSDNTHFYSDEPHLLEDAEEAVEPSESWQTLRRQAVKENSHLTVSAKRVNVTLPIASATRRDVDTAGEALLSHISGLSKDNANSDIKLSTNKSAAQTRHGQKGRHKLSSDSVQLLGGSKGSLQDSFGELDKGFSAV